MFQANSGSVFVTATFSLLRELFVWLVAAAVRLARCRSGAKARASYAGLNLQYRSLPRLAEATAFQSARCQNL